jgi:hypothetical protein
MGISYNEIMGQKHIFLRQQPLLIKLVSMHCQFMLMKVIDTFNNFHSNANGRTMELDCPSLMKFDHANKYNNIVTQRILQCTRLGRC